VREALGIVLARLVVVMKALEHFASRMAHTPTIAYTHFQPAQLTTVGKRATLWLHDFYLDAVAIRDAIEAMVCRGCKGTTGTQASYLDLFHGDHDKVRLLDEAMAARFGFKSSIAVSGQTYTRKLDSRILALLSGIAQSASKFATDLRLLQHEEEVLEPTEREQIGSSAMAYKRNPMRAERICALSRHVMSLETNAVNTAATQWLERTLDDSANRRISLPESFLAADAVLVLCSNVAAGLQVNEAVVARNVARVMPFMATERWLMLGVEAGGDRQTLHEIIRQHSRAVSDAMADGAENDLLDRLASDPAFAVVDARALRAELDPARYIGRAPEQVRDFAEGPLKDLYHTLVAYSAPDDAKVTL
jgi:adenylosuccinate lyase